MNQTVDKWFEQSFFTDGPLSYVHSLAIVNDGGCSFASDVCSKLKWSTNEQGQCSKYPLKLVNLAWTTQVMIISVCFCFLSKRNQNSSAVTVKKLMKKNNQLDLKTMTSFVLINSKKVKFQVLELHFLACLNFKNSKIPH